MLRIIFVSLLGILAPSQVTESTFPDDSYGRYSWETFCRLEAVNQPIDLESPDLELLNAAVFFVTNRERTQRGIRPLAFSPELRNCARHHATAMADHDFVSHFNVYEPRYRTLEKRSAAYGKDAHAENVASNFLHAYRSNTYYTPKAGRPFYAYIDDRNQPIPVLTYLQFAENLVDDWMHSSGHRRNILTRDLRFLGCAVQIPEGAGKTRDIPLAYCVQNFSY